MRSKIYLLGDSITQMSFAPAGWGASLANLFSRTADVVVRGYSGYNTRWALMALERVFPAEDGGSPPLAVTVFFGANDACLPDRSGAIQHVPLYEYKQNLRSIFAFLKKRWPSTCIVFITPPPIDEATHLRHSFGRDTLGLADRTNEAAGNYAKACLGVAKEFGIPAIDLWTKMQQFPGWESTCLSDGLHLAAAGNKIVFEQVSKTLKQQGISPETLPIDLPSWEDIDHQNPWKTFEN